MVERIRELLANEQMSPSQFADEIKLQRSSLSHVLSGRNKPSLDFVMKIKERFKEVNFDWLIFGKGEIFLKKEIPKATITHDEDLFSNRNPNMLNFESDNASLDQKSIPKKEIENRTIKENMHINSVSGKATRVILFYKNGTFEEFINE